MGEFSITHILVVLLVALIFFGPQKIASLGKDLGKGIRGFKTGISGDEVPPPRKKKKKRAALAAAREPAALGEGDVDVEPAQRG